MDTTDARLLFALIEDPRATVVSLARRLGLNRSTVQARLARLDDGEVLGSFERRIEPTPLGYPLTAYVFVTVVQKHLDDVAVAMADIPEVLEVSGLSGNPDLLLLVAAQTAEDLYRITGQILATTGVERTDTSLVMRKMVDYRVRPLLAEIVKQRRPT